MAKEASTISLLFGPVAQLVEQRIENPRVDGSIPSQATKHSVKAHLIDGLLREKSCGISSVGRAIPCQGIGREFESLIPLQIQKKGSQRFPFLSVGLKPIGFWFQ
jgi:hypothetical protein